ncbi:MAG TPA: serine O-acetyltransferase [Solirubrobacteraceae bacterium]|nr:serine O-acetyltransferase [Solirubrobacteraceae bacterium]
MAFARERNAAGSFSDLLARERQDYALPPRLHQLAESLVHRVLELLFPHFAAEVGRSTGDVSEELVALRGLLVDTLRLPAAHCTDPDSVADHLLAELPAIRAALLLDAEAIFDGDPAAQSVDEVILAYPGFFATAVYRIAHELYGSGVPLVPRVLTEIAHRDTGIDIHPGASIGESFAIDHGTGIVIGETAVLGARVKLYQGVTLGALSVDKRMARTKRHPTIGDDVVIYANATILGGDTVIGNGSRIGGNVWLTQSVAAHSVVTPTARVERQDGAPADDVLDFNI